MNKDSLIDQNLVQSYKTSIIRKEDPTYVSNY